MLRLHMGKKNTKKTTVMEKYEKTAERNRLKLAGRPEVSHRLLLGVLLCLFHSWNKIVC